MNGYSKMPENEQTKSAQETPDQQGVDELMGEPQPDLGSPADSGPGESSTPFASLADAEQRVLRAQAELENFRKRMRREMEEERRYANLPLLSSLLPVLDNLERAIQSAETAHQSGPLLEGVKMVIAQLVAVLEKHDCQRISAEGQPFDPNQHQAIAQIPSDQHPAGHVIQVAVGGFKLHDRVIRPAQVLVSAAAPQVESPLPETS